MISAGQAGQIRLCDCKAPWWFAILLYWIKDALYLILQLYPFFPSYYSNINNPRLVASRQPLL